ncbi:hypothetical protein EDM59_01500 [Brevibacillus nitrificans]|uniref:Uncharacterized protein n=1 Tax=Brevibacillus nitrificans TaxID=651560 RepID=A0A3M8DRN6_9BACL|nr:hypothetical protein [Brevibacillus nitrificans]RNB90149.1 hypothetical protein EDM59_01500 [Brevibacillus nitrificans]
MKVVVQNGVVVAITEIAEIVSGGIYIGNNTIFGDPNAKIYEIADIPPQVKPMEYLYSDEEGFILNPDYVPPTTVEEQMKSVREEIANLQRIVKRMNDDQLAFMEDILSMLQ